MAYLQIEVSDEELQELQEIALQQGFETLEEYIQLLTFEPTEKEILNDIREGILAAERGDPMMTIDELWAELERDNETVS
jgi:hypothetical protein